MSVLVLERYQQDLDELLRTGQKVVHALQYEFDRASFTELAQEQLGDEAQEFLDALPYFSDAYQPWYSEAKTLVKQLLPERLDDFVRYYERPRTARKDISYFNYTIEDALNGLRISRSLGPTAARRSVQQQVNIVGSIKSRFESSLFDIRQLTQADVFDSELETAKELVKNGFLRAAGIVAGVVLERHLKEVCTRRNVTVRKRRPQLSDLNDRLKDTGVIDTAQWRFNQHLGDLRNLCAHDDASEPSRDQVNDLVAGVAKVTKTIV